MSGSLKVFLAFCVVVAASAAIAVIWLGPQMLTMVLDDEQREKPMYALHFARYDSIDEAAWKSAYATPMSVLMQAVGGQSQWQGDLLRVVQGRRSDEWRVLELVRFPLAGEVVQSVTSAEFRALASPETGFDRMFVATQSVPARALDFGAICVILIEAPDAKAEHHRDLTANVAPHGGTVVWDTAVHVLDIGADEAWNRVIVVGFESEGAAEAWVLDAGSMTERSIASVRFRELAALVFSAG
ncbi:MAG: hypothetical protein QF921_11765 [Pseudomonadales bacterium]|mgnify:CR=1 FL=1|nr:hypothetical protein [Pseudomonadales bacterium]MDP6470533.1 hypothetical protein [Pseudomonadales bacterium]MDP6827835.1 hypothetical protein [Pseudomonadales bacterium]MDP6972167.1 hypothetical protein [Pseudomonadales bacterium]